MVALLASLLDIHPRRGQIVRIFLLITDDRRGFLFSNRANLAMPCGCTLNNEHRHTILEYSRMMIEDGAVNGRIQLVGIDGWHCGEHAGDFCRESGPYATPYGRRVPCNLCDEAEELFHIAPANDRFFREVIFNELVRMVVEQRHPASESVPDYLSFCLRSRN